MERPPGALTLPRDMLFLILEFIYPYVMNEKNSFILVCKDFKSATEHFFSTSYEFYRSSADNDSLVSFLESSLQHAVKMDVVGTGSRGPSFLCDYIWRAERLTVNVSSMRNSDTKKRRLYDYALNLLKVMKIDAKMQIMEAQEEKGLEAPIRQALAEVFAFKFSLLLFILNNNIDTLYVRSNNLPSLKMVARAFFAEIFTPLTSDVNSPVLLQDYIEEDEEGIKNFIYEGTTEENTIVIPSDHPFVLQSSVLSSLVCISKLYGRRSQNLVLSGYGKCYTLNMVRQMMSFCEHNAIDGMREIPKPLPSRRMLDFVQDWYVDFIAGLTYDELFELTLMGNDFGIKSLLDLTTASIDVMMHGANNTEIGQMFNVGPEASSGTTSSSSSSS